MFKSVTVLLTGLIWCVAFVVAAPYQELVPRAGYVPVYIREGDTPLSEIHPALAEAFGEEEKTLSNAKREISEKAKQDDSAVVAAQPEVIKQNINTEELQEESKLNEKLLLDEKPKNVDEPKEVEKPNDVPIEVTKTKVDLDEQPAIKVESDIASFDVIKALDKAEKDQ